MKIKTVQTFLVEYDIPAGEEARFLDMFDNDEDISEYEVNQEFLGEHIIERIDS